MDRAPARGVGLGAALCCLLALALTPEAFPRPALDPKHGDHGDGGRGDHGGGEGDPSASPLPALGSQRCTRGRAKGHPCHNVDLVALVPLAQLSPDPNDRARGVWGWVDPQTGREYALVPLATGTAFVDVTPGDAPLVLGYLPTSPGTGRFVSNREVNVYGDHALISADGNNAEGHGVQVFDLAQLRTVGAPPVTFSPTTVFRGVGRVHTITVNPETGFAYANGSDQCRGGLYIIDVRNPADPRAAGCYDGHDYTHDSQCVVYQGPDARFAGRELCFASNQDRLVVVDVTDKAAPRALAASTYPGRGYTHQGWLTEDHRYFLMDDEADEFFRGHFGRTWLWDLEDLTAPRLLGSHEARTAATDHNQYVHEGFVYQANYRAGLRILDLARIARGRLTEVGFFDVVPESDEPGFSGAWNVYPFLPSGRILVSGMEQGLYVLRWNGSRRPTAPADKIPAKCRPGKDHVCMQGGRLRVEASVPKPRGGALPGRWTALPGDSLAAARFDGGDDLELVVATVEEGGRPYLTYLELTDRPYSLKLTDTRGKTVRRYHDRFLCRQAGSFGGTGGGPGSCVPSSERLCLRDGRFAVEATWGDRVPPGRSGAAQAVPLTGATGGFTSGEPGGLELVAKVTVSGTEAVVRWGKLRDFDYTLRVTDTVTGATHELVDRTQGICVAPDPLF